MRATSDPHIYLSDGLKRQDTINALDQSGFGKI